VDEADERIAQVPSGLREEWLFPADGMALLHDRRIDPLTGEVERLPIVDDEQRLAAVDGGLLLAMDDVGTMTAASSPTARSAGPPTSWPSPGTLPSVRASW
jgi:hypothetical protein